METLEELRQSIEDMAKGITDTEQIGKVAVVKSHIDKLKAENDDLIKKLDDTKKLYRDAVINSAFPGEPKDDIIKKPQSFEDILKSTLSARKEK